MADVFGEEAGVGARSAVGMGALPNNIPVEIECIFEVQ
jgi:enamine deaminase RidA (YjgF/YER057c/UK114 family)